MQQVTILNIEVNCKGASFSILKLNFKTVFAGKVIVMLLPVVTAPLFRTSSEVNIAQLALAEILSQ